MATDKTIIIHEDAWNMYREQLYQFIMKRVGDSFVAEDITQDVLLRVYTHLDSLSSHEKFLPWLYRIARNAIADYYRRSHHESELPETLASAIAIEDEESAYTQLAPCLLALIQRLPSPYRMAIHYSELENLSQKGLAEKIGISLPGAKSRVQRGRKILKELLFQCCQIQLSMTGKLMDFQPNLNCKTCEDTSDSCML
ncbi:MAG: RNA polymerase sigma factor SigZ [Anaerolineae bacterium]|nr:RNA polymerase sigma factor SigZ [Anaerolineae bacterium]